MSELLRLMPYLTWKSYNYKFLKLSALLKNTENAFFLDSSLNNNISGRYSFLGFDPFYILKIKPSQNRDPFGGLKDLLERYKFDRGRKIGFPFLGGAVGYFSYDLGFCLENISEKAKDDLALPDLFFGFYDTIIAIDHFQGKLFVFSTGFPERGYLLAKKRAEFRMKEVISKLSGCEVKNKAQSHFSVSSNTRLKSNFTKEKYLKAINIAKEYIKKGDIYQVNLSQRFSTALDVESPVLYRRLRNISPSNFSAYLDCGDFQIISSSPERFLCFDGKNVSTRPMKGTRSRSKNKKEDSCLKRKLLKSEKDKAELIMIVDLMRNDLGRVCEYGSVKVSSMRNLESYSTVYQTTATIEGRLKADRDRIDLIKACFPGGSITGCPKIRSMQIIEELEPTKRAIYTGSLGYFGFNGTMDLNILIRTLLKRGNELHFQVGGGIVSDSEPLDEYEETLVKARGIFEAIGVKQKVCENEFAALDF